MSFMKKLRIFLVFGILGFLYDGCEAWASIIRDIRKKLGHKRHKGEE